MPSFHVNPHYAAMSEIVPGLFICGVSALKSEDIRNLGISTIINCTKEVPNLQRLVEMERIKLWLDDTEEEDISQHLHLISDRIDFARRGGGKILVHCVAGVSRSAAFCLAYLLKYQVKSLREAYHLMALKRPLVRPNLGFWRQLIAFERELKLKTSVRIVDAPTIEDGLEEQKIPDVYFPVVVPARDDQNKENQQQIGEGRERKSSGSLKFVPILEPLPECEA